MFCGKIRYLVALLFIACGSNVYSEIVMFGSGSNQFSMEFVPIGNPGNAPDTTGNPFRAGSVAYEYGMGKFEVSEDMITKYNAEYGIPNNFTITQNNRGPNRPATGVTWNEAALFVNWLNTSTGGFAAYNFASINFRDEMTGWTPAYPLDYDPSNPFRSLRAKYALPSMDEWYKAAYFDPTSETYFNFPTGSNTAPISVSGGTNANTAVFDQGDTADITNAGGLSPYGVMGLGGNVMEWEETAHDLYNDRSSENRGIRGGAWWHETLYLSSSTRFSSTPNTTSFDTLGFRVVSLSVAIPEPSSMLLVGLGTCVLSFARRQRSRNS